MSAATLALDLGTSAGWSLRTADGRVTSGTQTFKPGRHEGGGVSFLRFRGWRTATRAAADGIPEVCFEEVRHHTDIGTAHAKARFGSRLAPPVDPQALPTHEQVPSMRRAPL